jgi:8-oxo-dGTP diphosphatase
MGSHFSQSNKAMKKDFEALAKSILLDERKNNVDTNEDGSPNYLIPLTDFFHFGLSVDCVVFGFDGENLKILLIKRGASPFKHKWAIPGDLVYPNENLESAAFRVLKDLTGLKDVFMQQIKSFGDVDRHPLGRVVTVSYMALIRIENYLTEPAFWADEINWHYADNVKGLAFDHDEIFIKAIEKLRVRVRREPIGFELLPLKFTLNELQNLYEAVLDQSFDKGNFRKKILSMNLLIDLNELQTNVAHRPARLYSFDPDKYEQLKNKGFNFEL